VYHDPLSLIAYTGDPKACGPSRSVMREIDLEIRQLKEKFQP